MSGNKNLEKANWRDFQRKVINTCTNYTITMPDCRWITEISFIRLTESLLRMFSSHSSIFHNHCQSQLLGTLWQRLENPWNVFIHGADHGNNASTICNWKHFMCFFVNEKSVFVHFNNIAQRFHKKIHTINPKPYCLKFRWIRSKDLSEFYERAPISCDCANAGEGLQYFGFCSSLTAFEQGGIFIVPRL